MLNSIGSFAYSVLTEGRWLIGINIASFALMVIDKICAKARFSRIPEIVFFFLCAFGGFGGVLLAMFFPFIHHKRRKDSFIGMMLISIVAYFAILYFSKS